MAAAVLILLALLVPAGICQAQPQGAPREVGRINWDLVPEAEIFVRLIPEDPDGKSPLLQLVFQAFFPGRAERDRYRWGEWRWPSGRPARIVVKAQPLPLTIIRDLSLQLIVDGRTLDLTGPNSKYRNLPCLVAMSDCVPDAVEAELEPSTLKLLVSGRAVGGKALGFPIRLVGADLVALRGFTARIGLSEDEAKRQE